MIQLASVARLKGTPSCFYCNALNMWIAGATDKNELNQIAYGVSVPEQYQSEVLKAYLAAGGNEDELQTKTDE